MTSAFIDNLKEELEDPEFAILFGSAQAKSSFALTLVKAREKIGLTQKAFADKVGVSQAYIAKLEGGEANPTLGRIGALLGVIGLSLTTDTTTLFPYSETVDWESDWNYESVEISSSLQLSFEATISSPISEEKKLLEIT